MKVRWGVIGTGHIASQFAQGMVDTSNGVLFGVSSRNLEKARAFKEKYRAEKAYGSYREMVEDREVDGVYIATPHALHLEHALLALSQGKAVLCEKPLTLNRKQAKQMMDTAASQNVFLMEAMWTWFFPAMEKVRQLVQESVIGEIRMIQADMGFIAHRDPKGILLNLEMGGGGLLDLGVYTIALAQMIMDKPDRVLGMATMGETRVDEQASIILGYPNGAQAMLGCSLQTNPSHTAKIFGTKGVIEIARFFWKPLGVKLIRPTPYGVEDFSFPLKGNGYTYEIEHAGQCILEGRTQSPLVTWEKTLEVLSIMDELRYSWGMRYPGE